MNTIKAGSLTKKFKEAGLHLEVAKEPFIPRVTADIVRDAHDSLKTSTVTFAEGKAPGKTVRQGEWFFVHPTKEEKEAITAVTRKKRGAILRKTAIGAGGNPHVAEELIRMPSEAVGLKLAHGYPVQSRDAIYVRGGIRHVDHKTVKFKTWRRVIRNNEPSGAAAPAGVGWID